MGDGPSLGCVGQVPEKTGRNDGMPLASSLILTCRAIIENDRKGRQTAICPHPGLGQTDCRVDNTAATRKFRGPGNLQYSANPTP